MQLCWVFGSQQQLSQRLEASPTVWFAPVGSRQSSLDGISGWCWPGVVLFFQLEERTGQRSVQKEWEKDKKWCGSRRGGNKEGGKESRTPGRDGKRPASQPILCVCAPRSVKERKETERPFPSGLAGLTTEESRFSGLVWGRPGLGEMIMQAHWETRPATPGLDSPALNECPCLWEGVSQKACCYSRQGMPMPEWEHWLCEWYEVGTPAGPGGFTLLLSHSCLGSNGRMGQRVSFSSSEVGIRAVSPEIPLGLSSIERFRPRGRTTLSGHPALFWKAVWHRRGGEHGAKPQGGIERV